MNDSVDRLAKALSDRYKIESEWGQGGMATVYLAHDVYQTFDSCLAWAEANQVAPD